MQKIIMAYDKYDRDRKVKTEEKREKVQYHAQHRDTRK